jgi:adenosylcobinamide kinase/adenosylcobinamide-phosphate guanylyltransferase
MPLPFLSLVLGGASSGKSAFAEGLVTDTRRPRVYIATAQAFDFEMEIKITAHRAQRGPGWRTVEEPLDMAAALAGIDADAVALIDCATLWLTNHLLAENDLDTAADAFCAALAACSAPIVVVSNEVGQGIVPDNVLSRRFRAAQGRLNQRLAMQAGLVVAVMAGLPLILKGQLP